MMENKKTLTAGGKSAECRPPSYEELCAQNQNCTGSA